MSAISALKSRHRRQALAAQKAAEPALHITQHSNGAEPSEITPKCNHDYSTDQGALVCYHCGYVKI
jgi:hypothetical protein